MKEAQMAIPLLFRCPISLELFSDPVTLCTGQTYDRSSIEKWLAAGNLTCPVTMQRLHDLSIVPNHTLRHLIQQWLQTGHQLDPEYFKTIDPDRYLAALKHNLESHESTLENKGQTVEKIRNFYDEFPSRSSCLIQLGFLSLILELLLDEVEAIIVDSSQEILKFGEQALSCIVKLLPLGQLGPLNVLKEESKLASFLGLFEHGNMMIKMSLCQIVKAISTSLETKELGAMLGQDRRLLHGIILLLHQNSEAAEAGIETLWALCSLESNRENLISEGAVDGLIAYINLRSERISLVPTAMATLEVLLGVESGKVALINNPNGVNSLVKMVFRVSYHEGSESAVNSLMMVCYDSLRAREEAICAGVLTQLLLLLQSQCGGRSKSRARMLLKLLSSMWDESRNV